MTIKTSDPLDDSVGGEPLAVIVYDNEGKFRTVEWAVFRAILRKRQLPPERQPGKGRKPDPNGLRATLLRALANGPRKVGPLQAELKQRWHPDSIRDMRRKLGIRSTKVGPYDWEWSLPDER